MQAAFYEHTGPASDVLRLAELPIPIPGPGEVRVKVSWSGVNPSDVKMRAGLRSKILGARGRVRLFFRSLRRQCYEN